MTGAFVHLAKWWRSFGAEETARQRSGSSISGITCVIRRSSPCFARIQRSASPNLRWTQCKTSATRIRELFIEACRESPTAKGPSGNEFPNGPFGCPPCSEIVGEQLLKHFATFRPAFPHGHGHPA